MVATVEQTQRLNGELIGWLKERRRSDKGRVYAALISPDGKHFPSENAAMRWLKDGCVRKRMSSRISPSKSIGTRNKIAKKEPIKRERHKRVIFNEEGHEVPIEPQRALNRNLPHCGKYAAGDDLPNWTVEHAQTVDGIKFLLYRNPKGEAIGSRGSALMATNQLEVPTAIREQIGYLQEEARKRRRMLESDLCLPESALNVLSSPWVPVRDLKKKYNDWFGECARMAMIAKMRRVESVASRVLVVDLFCGIGGFSLGASSLGIGHIIGIDMEKGCVAAHHANRCGKKSVVYQLRESDLRRWAELLSPYRDQLILLASPPCQPYSCTGASNGVSDQRDGMPFFTRLCEMVRPLGAVLENVPTILHEKHSKAINPQLIRLKNAGYEMMLDVFDCKEFDVAQKRRRAVGVFLRNDLPGRVLSPMPCLRLIPTSKDVELSAGDALKRSSLWSGDNEPDLIPTSLAMRSRDRIRQGGERTGLVFQNRLAPTILTTSLHDNSYYRLFAVPTDNARLKNKDLRALSVTDLLDLQGFPSEYKMYQHARFQGHCAGNAIPPPLARAAIKSLMHALRTLGCTPPRIDMTSAIEQIASTILSWQ